MKRNVSMYRQVPIEDTQIRMCLCETNLLAI